METTQNQDSNIEIRDLIAQRFAKGLADRVLTWIVGPVVVVSILAFIVARHISNTCPWCSAYRGRCQNSPRLGGIRRLL